MSSLKTLQEKFQAYMLSNNSVRSNDTLDIIDPEIIKPDIGLVKNRLDVYRDGYSIRLIDILASDFPILVKLMGKKAFEKLAQDYVFTTQSRHFSVCEYGQKYAEFLQQKAVHPSFIEMAEFEWALAQAAVAQPAPVLTVADLINIAPDDWPALSFTFHPSLTVHHFHYNIGQLWRALKEEIKPPRRSARKKPTLWLVWCYHNESYFCGLDPYQTLLFNSLKNGLSFEAACQNLCQHLPEQNAGEFAGLTLRGWVEDGLIFTASQ